MALNINGDDITDALGGGGGGGGPSVNDPIQDAKLLTLENKTQNINSVSTDGTKTEFTNKIIVPEIEQALNKFYVYNNDPLGLNTNYKDNNIPVFDVDGKKIKHSNFNIKPDNLRGAVLEMDDATSSGNCFIGLNQIASGFQNVHIGNSISAGNNLNNNNILLGSTLKGGNGQFNVVLGTTSGPLVINSTGSNNVCIGKNTGTSVNTGNDNIFIGSLCFSTIDSERSIGIGSDAIVRRNDECVISSTIIRPATDNVCDLGTSSINPLHVARYRNLYLANQIECKDILSSGFIETPIVSSTKINTLQITNQDPIPNLCIELTPTTGIIKVHKNIIPSLANTLNIGADTASERFNLIASQVIILNDKGQSNKWYNQNGTAGLDIANTAVGGVNLSGSKYQGHNNSIVTLNGSGQFQQPSDNASVDGNGNIICKNLELLNIASSGVIKAKEIQSNDATNTLSLLNRATIAGKGIIIDSTTNGNIQLTGNSYIGSANNMLRLNTNGTLEKVPITIDGATNNNISNVNNLYTASVFSENVVNTNSVYSPNFFMGIIFAGTASAGTMNLNSGTITNSGSITPHTDNISDIGSLALSYKNIYIKGDVFKNGVAIGGGGAIAGISSVNNGANDIEISFTGSDYLQQGYLSIDVNGKIQVVPSIVLSNTEYNGIYQKWIAQRPIVDEEIVKIYLPGGINPGSFDHTLHSVYLAVINPANNTKKIYLVQFIGYIVNGTPSTTIGFSNPTNIINALEIYNLTSQAHPNQIANPNDKQHIINHFISDFNFTDYNSNAITNITSVAVMAGDVGIWDHTKPFWLIYAMNGSAINIAAIFTLYGSQNGWSDIGSSLPSGYTEIF